MPFPSDGEIFDVVDDQDQVIGKAPRKEVHAKNLNHRAVHILIFNSKNEFLLQLRRPDKDKYPNCWDTSSAGHVDSGEGYEQAAIRELKEELGIDVSKLDEIDYLPTSEETGFEFIRVYKLIHDGPFQPQESEISELRWVSPSKLVEWMKEKPQEFTRILPHIWKKLNL
jgi:16S rRNA (adenine1518-N6/adenine1519-N6)-dimethyltransferase